MAEKRKPLNPRVKISPRGVPYVERETLVKERLERIAASSKGQACNSVCSGCEGCDHHLQIQDDGMMICFHCNFSRPVTASEASAIHIVNNWGYEEPYWWAPIAKKIDQEIDDARVLERKRIERLVIQLIKSNCQMPHDLPIVQHKASGLIEAIYKGNYLEREAEHGRETNE